MHMGFGLSMIGSRRRPWGSVSGAGATTTYANVTFTGTAPTSTETAALRFFRGATSSFASAAQIGTDVAVLPGAAFSERVGPASITNLVVNGDFATDTNWTKGAGWTIAAGIASRALAAGSRLVQALTYTAGSIYRIGAGATVSAGTITPELFGDTNVTGAGFTATGTIQARLTAPTTPVSIRFLGNASFVGSIDNAVMFLEAAGMVEAGLGYFWVAPVTSTGVLGTPSGPFALTII